MKFLERTMYLVIIVVTISKFSLEECQKGTLKDVCWTRFNGSDFCADFLHSPVLNCTHLNDLNSDYKNTSVVAAIQIYNDSTSSILGTGLFKNFKEVKLINITKTNISHIKGGSLSNLYHLKYVFLNDNHIQGLSKETFEGLKSVEVLNLTRNNITHIKDNSFIGLSTLSELYLSHNHIADLSFWSPNCETLTTLDLSHNEIEILQLPNCTNLKYVNIAGNKINNLKASVFTNNLIYLDASWNKLLSIGDDFLRNFSQLEVLNLGGNPVFKTKNVPVDFFHNSQTLKVLNLSSTSIARLDNGVFQMLTNLERLDLSANYLKSLPKLLFYKVSKLRMIDLSGNMLTNLELNEFSSSVVLHLDNNNWTCETLANIFTVNVYVVSIANGDYHDGPNVHGIRCQSEIETVSVDTQDPSFLQKKYLSSLIEGQTDLKKVFNELRLRLNYTYTRHNYFSKNYLKSMQNSLITRDAILYSMFVVSLTITAIFAVIYFDRRRNSTSTRNRGELLRTISVSS